jgi:hypothetical protein
MIDIVIDHFLGMKDFDFCFFCLNYDDEKYDSKENGTIV